MKRRTGKVFSIVFRISFALPFRSSGTIASQPTIPKVASNFFTNSSNPVDHPALVCLRIDVIISLIRPGSITNGCVNFIRMPHPLSPPCTQSAIWLHLSRRTKFNPGPCPSRQGVIIKTRKWLIVGSLIFLALVILTAPIHPGQKPKLRYRVMYNQYQDEFFNRMADEFEKLHPEVDVVI
jgi:hypothetical protein